MLLTEPTVCDSQGKEWDGKLSAAFQFRWVKKGDGYRMVYVRIWADPTSYHKLMMWNYYKTPEEVGNQIMGLY